MIVIQYKKFQMYKKIGISIFIIFLLIALIVFIKINRNKKLLEYNKKHKKKFDTYSELNNHLKQKREKEWKKFEKKQEKEWELKRKKEEAEIKAEEANVEKFCDGDFCDVEITPTTGDNDDQDYAN